MTSSKEYLEYIMEQLSDLDDVSYRAMMGEYIIYYRGKIVGGIYDDRLLVKPVKSAIALMPNATYELPYEGAKEMLLIDNVDSREFLEELFPLCTTNSQCPRKRNNRHQPSRALTLCSAFPLTFRAFAVIIASRNTEY